MVKQKSILGVALVILVVPALLVAGWGLGQRGFAVQAAQAGQTSHLEGIPAQQSDSPEAGDPLVLSYSVKFVCTESLQPGTHFYGAVAPIVQQKTDILIHNPHEFQVTLYKKAVRASLETAPPVAPGDWVLLKIDPDYAVRIDCDDIAKLLTGNPSATFIGTYGIGVTVEGFVVIGIGPQDIGAANLRYAPLDVTADYVRSSEVLKKDITYQPWWWWWWWGLPWRLAYPYERIVHINPLYPVDCRDQLYQTLAQDAIQTITDQGQLSATLAALDVGRQLDPTHLPDGTTQPALVALIGRCDKLSTSAPLVENMAIDYVIVSNKAPTDPSPLDGQAQPSQIAYPWIPGRWYDLPVVIPQNYSTDLDNYFHEWQVQRWIDAGEDAGTVRSAMVYYFPYWCGWGYWWPWWNGGDCEDIGVGEGESLDVEQINPTRVFMTVWPPPLSAE